VGGDSNVSIFKKTFGKLFGIVVKRGMPKTLMIDE
jgi:hypothetical protein